MAGPDIAPAGDRLAPAPPRSGGEPPAHARLPQMPWTARLVDLLSAYLPLLLMGLLALGTWWLVKNSPALDVPGPARPPLHIPDYTMSGFSVERFTREGRLRARINGRELRHYPDTDTVEIDQPRIQAFAPDGRSTVATARRAVSNGDGSEVQLLGDALVVREAGGGEAATAFRGEFLHAFLATEEVRSHLPVTVTRGGSEFRADALDYRHRDQRVQLKGRVRLEMAAGGEAQRGKTLP